LKIKKEFIIGALVTISLALLYWGINFLKGESIFSNERVFIAVYNDVAGLEKANPIAINGMKVGQVRNMYFSDDQHAKIVLELVVRNTIAIPKNSTAKIINDGLLGSKAVELKLGNSPELAQSGDTLISEVEVSIKEEVNRQLMPIKSKAEDLMLQIDTVLTMLQSIFSTDNTDNFSKSVRHIANSFENLESTTSNLDTLIAGQRSRLEHIFENIESITLNLKQNEDKLNNIIANFSAVSDSIAKIQFAETMESVNTTMANAADIFEKINNGEGSMGLLINNDSLYLELEKSSKDLNLLLEDIRLNPKKYVRFSVF
jgi:phospholipid/cholesterol/gamma-HCH transport system substrate-binding protein